ncbi:MAG: 2-amino-4-hydroxy-6-hydroxymethyldihydropteridine diphosphokinase [Chloroflexi bacterium]|nr:2-amino-4-hydroxy-6-hydroxymethyldihydropteridine diphosphokinase [Chloroflexota bacterium]MBU1662703.1 2-amino-4-hydroxy-6-hydroxymethyldihydropteridine diphosphokinase [Chloroflexota bacterium]
MNHIIYIALGTNLGDRPANLLAAVAALPPDVCVTAESPVYQTAPWGYTDQPDFLNQVVRGETVLPPNKLLAYLKEIETNVGRTPTFRYGPRVVDLDILFYDNLTLEQPDLTIPHPRLHERAFVLIPLADLAPSLRHPISKATISELLANVDTVEIERFSG